MNALGFAAVVVTGFIAGAEFGSYAFVHPVLRRLPTRERIVVEQGLLRTFGRVTEEGVRTTNPGLRNLRTTDNLGRGQDRRRRRPSVTGRGDVDRPGRTTKGLS